MHIRLSGRNAGKGPLSRGDGKITARLFRSKQDARCRQLPPGGRTLHYIDNHDICSDAGENRCEKVIGKKGAEACLAVDFLPDGIPFVFHTKERES